MEKSLSIYVRKFDSNSRNWSGDPEYDVIYLRQQEHEFNWMLQTRGYLLLTEVLQNLDLEIFKEDLVVGWTNKGNESDGFVKLDLLVDYEDNSIDIDFNVDGDISNHFKERG